MGARTHVLSALALLLLVVLAVPASGTPARSPEARPQEADRLKKFLSQERPQFEKRETRRKGLIDELDRLSLDRSRLRGRVEEMEHLEQELHMSLENLGQEARRERDRESFEREHLRAFAKLAYRLRRSGVLPFLVEGETVAQAAARLRLVLRLLETQARTMQSAATRADRLAKNEEQLQATRTRLTGVSRQIAEEQKQLSRLDDRKRSLIAELDKKQSRYREVEKEYARVARELAGLFQNFEELRETVADGFRPGQASLPLPIENGVIARGYGKSVHHRFRTVTFHKGIEILAPLGTPVRAVLPGIVEYDGWVKGLGNVAILHHGGGFYSLHAHLGKVLAQKGMKVAQGDHIGVVGDTGTNDKPSLYFELRENGKTVDPVPYFTQKAVAKLR